MNLPVRIVELCKIPRGTFLYVVAVLVFVIAVGVTLIALTAAREAYVHFMTSACASRWQRAALQTKWEFSVGCLVYVDGRWVPEQNVQLPPKNSK
jgi:hypothetical protein